MKKKKYHYILLKEHLITGLKYLCKHVTAYPNSIEKYTGSGVYWKRHLNKHGEHIKTTILEKCETNEEAIERGRYYSELWNVVESKEFANLVVEEGQGGAGPVKYRKNHTGWRGLRFMGNDNPSKRPEVRKKISNALKGREFSDEWKKKLSEKAKGRTPWNKGNANPSASTDHMNIKIECPHCGKIGGKGAMKRWHFDHCKLK